MKSDTYEGSDGFKIASHWYENMQTGSGERFEMKVKFGWEEIQNY